jgi:sodium/potassium-transporting ATPase subunit alpha
MAPGAAEAKSEQLKNEYRAELLAKKIVEWPTVGDASESGMIKFFQALADIEEARNE